MSEMTATVRERAARECAEWLGACLRLGWRQSDLDFLEALWWKYHDERGNLRSRRPGKASVKKYGKSRRVIPQRAA